MVNPSNICSVGAQVTLDKQELESQMMDMSRIWYNFLSRKIKLGNWLLVISIQCYSQRKDIFTVLDMVFMGNLVLAIQKTHWSLAKFNYFKSNRLIIQTISFWDMLKRLLKYYLEILLLDIIIHWLSQETEMYTLVVQASKGNLDWVI